MHHFGKEKKKRNIVYGANIIISGRWKFIFVMNIYLKPYYSRTNVKWYKLISKIIDLKKLISNHILSSFIVQYVTIY